MENLENNKKIVLTPPIYLASADMECWKCGSKMKVVAIIATGSIETLGNVITLNNIESLPDNILEYIQKYYPTFKLIHSKTMDMKYYANTCPACGVVAGDFFVHFEPDSPLFPISEEEAACIDVEEIPFSQEFKITSGYSMGIEDIILEKGNRISRK